MILDKKLKIIGNTSITLGIIAALLCITPISFGVFFAILAGFFGMIMSSIYIFIDTKHEFNTKKLTPGIIGMMLSSIPIVFMLVIIILSKINK
jgi:nicotinamide riboside transporter PnuC